MKNKTKKDKLRITLVNTRTMKTEEVHFPVITPTRKKHFDFLESQNGDKYIILCADFHITEVNEMLLRNGTNVDINALNYWATLYFVECEDADRKIFDVLVKSKYVPINTVKDMLDILANLNRYYYVENVTTHKAIALFHMKLQCVLGKPVDYKSVPDWCLEEAGKAIAENEEGVFYKNYYIGLYRGIKVKKDNPEIYKVPESLKLV